MILELITRQLSHYAPLSHFALRYTNDFSHIFELRFRALNKNPQNPNEVETWNIDDVITLVTLLVCNLLAKNYLQLKPRSQVDDAIDQIHLSREILAQIQNFTPFWGIEKWKVNLGQ